MGTAAKRELKKNCVIFDAVIFNYIIWCVTLLVISSKFILLSYTTWNNAFTFISSI